MSRQYQLLVSAVKNKKTLNARLHWLKNAIVDYSGVQNGNKLWLPGSYMFTEIYDIFKFLENNLKYVSHGFFRHPHNKYRNYYRKLYKSNHQHVEYIVSISPKIYFDNTTFQKFIQNSLFIGRLILTRLMSLSDDQYKKEYKTKLQQIITQYKQTCLDHFTNQSYTQLLLKKIVPTDVQNLINGYINDLDIFNPSYSTYAYIQTSQFEILKGIRECEYVSYSSHSKRR